MIGFNLQRRPSRPPALWLLPSWEANDSINLKNIKNLNTHQKPVIDNINVIKINDTTKRNVTENADDEEIENIKKKTSKSYNLKF